MGLIEFSAYFMAGGFIALMGFIVYGSSVVVSERRKMWQAGITDYYGNPVKKEKVMQSYTVEVKAVDESVDSDLYIELPEVMLNQLGWHENSTLQWVFKEDGTIVLKLAEEENE